MANYKRIFLNGYSYFLTVVTHRRNPILVENIDILRECFRESKRFYDYYINAIVILPDHFHIIITPKNANDYPNIIKSIKYNFTRKCKIGYEEQSISRYKKSMKPVWQKRYYEHTIRNEKDYVRCLDYIFNNPIKHGYVENIVDWEYSSFHKK